MKKLLLSILLVLPAVLQAQAPAVLWSEVYGGTQMDDIHGFVKTADHGFVVAHHTLSNDSDVVGSHGSEDVWIVKNDSVGNIVWAQAYGGSDIDITSDIELTPDSGFIIVGMTTSSDGDLVMNHGWYDLWVLKLSATGAIEWSRTYGGSELDQGRAVDVTDDGGYIVLATSESSDGDASPGHGYGDLWIVKLDVSGNIQWEKKYGGTDYDYGRDIKQNQAGGYVATGRISSSDGDVTGSHGNYEAWVIQVDSAGNLDWQKCLGGSLNDEPKQILLLQTGEYIISGNTNSSNGTFVGNHGDYDAWLVKMDTSGNIVWKKVYGGSDEEGYLGIQETGDGGLIAIGLATSGDGDVTGHHGGGDAWLVKMDNAGTIEWQKCIGGGDFDYGVEVRENGPGRYIVGAYSSSDDGDVPFHMGPTSYSDSWMIGLGPGSGLSFSNEKDEQILSVYPNPTNGEIWLTGKDLVSGHIFITGQLGQLMQQQTYSGGIQKMDVSHLPSGIYFLTLHTGERSYTQKIILTGK